MIKDWSSKDWLEIKEHTWEYLEDPLFYVAVICFILLLSKF